MTVEAIDVPVSRFRSSAQVGDLTAALAKAQGEIEGAAKDAENPHFKSRYANLASVWKAIRQPLSKNGLAVMQPYVDGHLITRLCHGEQWVESDVRVTLEQHAGVTAVQALGSALTYLRRYCLSTLVGVAPDDDDDGESASGVVVGRQQDQRRALPPPAPPVQRQVPQQQAVPPRPAPPPNDDAIVAAFTTRLRAAATMSELLAVGQDLAKSPMGPDARRGLRELYADLREEVSR